MVWRTLEHAGVGLLIASAFSATLLAVIWLRGGAPVEATLFALSLGAACGLTRSVLSRPGALDTAMRIDHTLGSPDLFSTALSLTQRRGESDPFANAVVAIANARARGVSPSTLVLRRLGSRAWGGIGIAGASVLTLALLVSQPTQSRARSDLADRTTSTDQSIPIATTDVPSSASPFIAPAATATDDSSDSAQSANASADRHADASAAASGDGASRTTDTSAAASPPRARTAADSRSQLPASGGAGSASAGESAGLSLGSVDAPVRTAAPPWSGPTWSADRAAALRTIQDARIPDDYRDLVREYFQRP
ncbi:MAG: hypothetical protein ACREJC_20615 [Tepidisphaeraceae bacterium]